MKKIIYIAIAFLFLACDSGNGSDCFKKEGAIVLREIAVAPFTEIVVFERVQLFIEEGPVQKVIVASGENLIDDVEVKVANNQLSLIDNNSCNFIRDYNTTKVYVTSPNITKIRNSSSLEITSIGVLTYPKIELFSENYESEGLYRTDGGFKLSLDVEEVDVTSNGISTFRLSGAANKADFGLYAGNTRILAENLMVNELHLFHRSTDRMLVNPIESIEGEIFGVGDVFSKNRPPIIEVEEFFTGKLIFED